jgi:hypothetical protein
VKPACSACCVFGARCTFRVNTKKEKQFDVIAKSNILSSLYVGVFNRVFNCKNAHELLSHPEISNFQDVNRKNN